MTEKDWMRPLSLRERQLALLIADGLTNREMAEKLGLSVFTVRNEVGRILRKLKAKSRSQIAYAVGRRS
jgi:DNA-binding CsgD family transcriptional regulator